MNIIQSRSIQLAMRPIAVLILAAIVFAALTPGTLAEAKGRRTGVFGTVVQSPANGQVEVISRNGVITLTISDKTKIVTKRGGLELDEVNPGDSATGYYEEKGGQNVAGKLTFLAGDDPVTFEHIIGVVVDITDDTITLQTGDGDEVELETPPTADEVTEGSLIVTAVEQNSETGELDAQAIASAEKTVEKLNDAIGNEITLAQQKLLKVRMSETASAHLTKLYATLDEIKRDSQAKIDAAFAEFEQNYKKTLDPADLENLRVVIYGRVLAVSTTQLTVAANGNGRRSHLIVNEDVEVHLLDGIQGIYSNVLPQMYVEVSAIPQTQASSPIARLIKLVPAPESPGKNDEGGKKISGTIVIVDDGDSGTQQLIVITDPDGSDDAVNVTPDTIITGEEELEPGQEVEVTVGDDGFTAEEVEVVEPSEDDDTPTPTPSPPVEYKLSGKIREVIGDSVILDDVYLTLNDIMPVDDPLTVGEQIQFTVIIDEQGRWVIMGIEP